MNERIKELAVQAGMTDDKFGMFFALDKHNEDGVDLEKFAELIVRECADLCLKHETLQGPFETMEYRKGRHFSTMMKNHFGVEQ